MKKANETNNMGLTTHIDKDCIGKDTAQQVYIYKSHRQNGTFLYLPIKDNFDVIPQKLLKLLGELSFSFEFTLTQNRKLIQTDAKTVLSHISEAGYYVQLAPSSNFIPTSLDDALPSGF